MVWPGFDYHPRLIQGKTERMNFATKFLKKHQFNKSICKVISGWNKFNYYWLMLCQVNTKFKHQLRIN